MGCSEKTESLPEYVYLRERTGRTEYCRDAKPRKIMDF
jgi:hypothetical protein